jgi:Tol biopolymer transport system component
VDKRVAIAVWCSILVLSACTGAKTPVQLVAAPVTPSASPVIRTTPAPVDGLLESQGAILGFGMRWGLVAFDRERTRWQSVYRCQGQCTLIPDASWSLDGNRVAFTAVCAGACGTQGNPYHGIHVVDLPTGRDRLIAHGDDFIDVALSPDGSRLASAEGGLKVIDVDVDGSSPVTLTDGGARVDSPTWSPDGRRIAFSLLGDRSIHVVDVDEPAPTSLTVGRFPAWSPDGTRIAYTSGCAIWKVSVDGSQRSQIAGPELLGRRWCHHRNGWWFQPQIGPVWSPDGSRLAMMAGGRLLAIPIDGSPSRVLAAAPHLRNIIGITWEPDA